MCLYYDTDLTLKILNDTNTFNDMFVSLSNNLPKFKYDFEIKRVMIGLICLLSLNTIPDSLKEGMPDILVALGNLSSK